MAEELLKKISPEKRWTITAKTLGGFLALRGDKIMPSVLGKDEGIIAPVLGWEKYLEINSKVFGDGLKQFYRFVKETFNIPVEDAVGANKLAYVVVKLQAGPDWEVEFPEETKERVVFRATKCAWWERYNEQEVNPELRPCLPVCGVRVDEAQKAINPRITVTLTKARPRGDPYCEWVTEFNDE